MVVKYTLVFCCFYCFWGGNYTVCMIDSFCRYMNRKPQCDLSGTLRKVEGKHCVFHKRCFPNMFSQTYPSNIPYFPSLEFRSCFISHEPTIYPLVNVYVTIERSTIFHGKTHYFDWAIFNSYVSHNQRVDPMNFVGENHRFTCLLQRLAVCRVRMLHR